MTILNLPDVKNETTSVQSLVDQTTHPEPDNEIPISLPVTDRLVDPGQPLKFGARSDFLKVLRQRVDEYFTTTGQPLRDCPQMYVKTAIILSWFVASYALLVFFAATWWQAFPLAISLGLAMAAVGFNVQHDGGHQAYSNHNWINKLSALTLDLLGGSSYTWNRKHNSMHHTFANINGHDDDINIGILGRLAPDQKRLKFHRLQHFYLWVLYGTMTIKWQIYDDFRDVLTGRIGGQPFGRPRGWDLVVFIVGKLLFFSVAFVVPMLVCGVWPALMFYVVAAFVQGVTLSVVFQLAHCVEEADFPLPDEKTGRIENTWAIHQVETTVNFSRKNRLVTWYTGGLNFQIEHHLFPRICHINFPAISRLVEETCMECGIKYAMHPSFFAGIASHFRWLQRMGMPTAA